jgi:hypothetical protein
VTNALLLTHVMRAARAQAATENPHRAGAAPSADVTLGDADLSADAASRARATSSACATAKARIKPSADATPAASDPTVAPVASALR